MTVPTLPQLLLRNAANAGGQVGQRHKRRGIWVEYDWVGIADRVLRLAAGFRRMGLQEGRAILIVGDNEPEHIWAELAVQAIGGISISLYPDISTGEIEHIVSDSGARLAVVQDQEQVDKLLALPLAHGVERIVYWDEDGLWSYKDNRLANMSELLGDAEGLEAAKACVAAGQADDIACLSYTSGTTSKPKGVICTHRHLLDNAARLQAAVQLQSGDAYLSYTPLAWATEQYLGVGLALQLPLVVHFPERPDQVPEAIREIAPHLLVFGSRQWEALASQVHARMLDATRWRRVLFESLLATVARIDERRRRGSDFALDPVVRAVCDRLVLHGVRDQLGLTRVRTALLGGSAMAPDAFAFFHALRVPLRNAYGCSEFGVVMGHVGARPNVESIGSVLPVEPRFGPPLEARISDLGELELRGGTGFRGYWNQPEKTAERWRDGWFRTGDVVTESQGDFVYIDREQDMRKLAGGETFSPSFLEVRLRFSPYIKDVLVIGDTSRPHVVALLNIDDTTLSQWAEAHRIAFGGYAELSQHPKVLELLAAEVRKVNRHLPAGAQVRRFATFPKELDPDEGELTRTRKLKREVVQARYAGLIEALYTLARTHETQVDVTLQDGRKGAFSWVVALCEADPAARSATERPQLESA